DQQAGGDRQQSRRNIGADIQQRIGLGPLLVRHFDADQSQSAQLAQPLAHARQDGGGQQQGRRRGMHGQYHGGHRQGRRRSAEQQYRADRQLLGGELHTGRAHEHEAGHATRHQRAADMQQRGQQGRPQ